MNNDDLNIDDSIFDGIEDLEDIEDDEANVDMMTMADSLNPDLLKGEKSLKNPTNQLLDEDDIEDDLSDYFTNSEDEDNILRNFDININENKTDDLEEDLEDLEEDEDNILKSFDVNIEENKTDDLLDEELVDDIDDISETDITLLSMMSSIETSDTIDDIDDILGGSVDDTYNLAEDDLYGDLDDEVLEDVEIDFKTGLVKEKVAKDIVDVDIFTSKINKSLDKKDLRHLKIVSTTANSLRKIDRDKILETLINADANTEASKRTISNVNKLLEDMLPRLEYLDKVYTGFRYTLDSQFRYKRTNKTYKTLHMLNTEVALALNDFLRINLIGDFYGEPTVTIPPTFEELEKLSVYKSLSYANSHEAALSKTITLANAYRIKKSFTEEEYKNLTLFDIFLDMRFEYLAVKDHYEMMRNELIAIQLKAEKEAKENNLFIETRLEQLIPEENLVRNKYKDLFDSIRGKYTNVYTKKILEDFVYVSKIILSDKESSFICGNCNEKSTIQTPFVKFLYFTATQGYTFQEPVMGFNECPHCGKINTLTGAELKEFKKLRETRMMDSKKVAEILQDFSKDLYGALLPGVDIYEAVMQERFSTVSDYDADFSLIKEEEVVTKMGAKGNINPIDDKYIAALREYRRVLSLYRSTKPKELSENVKSQISKCNTEILVKLNKKTADAIGKTHERITVNMGVNSPSIESFLKVACSLTGKDYITERRNSILSFINFLNNSFLRPRFNSMVIKELEIIHNSLDSMNYFCDISKSNEGDRKLAEEILFSRITILNKTGNMSLEYMQEEFNKVTTDFIGKEKLAYETQRDMTLREIYSLSNLYACIPVTSFETTNMSHIIPYISDNKIWEMVLYISQLMMINDLSEKLMSTTVLSALTDATSRKRLLDQSSTEHRTLMQSLNSLYKMPKNEDFHVKLAGLSSAGRGLYSTDLLPISQLRNAILYKDEFNFYSSIYNLSGLNSIEIKEIKGIKPLINQYRKEAEDFVEKYGSDDYDRLLYLYKLQFKEDEIDELLIDDNVKLYRDNLPLRLEGESFSDYVKRKPEMDSDVLPVNDNLFKGLDKYLIELTGLKAFAEFINTNVNNLELYLAGADMFRIALTYKENVWLDILHLDTKMVNAINNSIPDFDFSKDVEIDIPNEAEMFLAKAFYPNYKLNKNVLLCDSEFKVVEDDDETLTRKPIGFVQYKGYKEYKEGTEATYISPYTEERMQEWETLNREQSRN